MSFQKENNFQNHSFTEKDLDDSSDCTPCQQSDRTRSIFGKEPWLAVNLSFLFPGIGQIYSGKTLRGYLLATIYLLSIAIGLYFSVSTFGNIFIGFGCLLGALFLFLYNLFDAYYCVKLGNNDAFEQSRKGSKDPWLAVFISRLFLGLGHIYIGRYWLGSILLFLSTLTYVVSLKASETWLYITIGTWLYIILLVVSPLFFYHLCIDKKVRQTLSKKTILFLSILILTFPIGLSALFSININAFITEFRYIPSESMLPTLQINDFIVIDKVSYRLQAPQRGDVVIFSATEALRKNGFTNVFVKRIIGLPGEKLKVKAGKVYINDRPLTENYIADEPEYETTSITVPSNSYFVLGDNRNNAFDSHIWGFVPKENIIGKATKIFYPFKRMGRIK
ncbi:MAG: signal peptidase I [Xenococcaceae cyanobacterium]